MAGWNLLADVRHQVATQDMPVILGSTSMQLLEKAEAARVNWGGNHHFFKLFSFDSLLQAFRELVGPA